MSYNGSSGGSYSTQSPAPSSMDLVSGEQYRYALTNFRIAHEKVEDQRKQLEEQERQVALLRERIALLEGNDRQREQRQSTPKGGSSVDDFSIKNAASQLERTINRWAADVVRAPPAPLEKIHGALLQDIQDIVDGFPVTNVSPMNVQNLLRHAMSELISAEIINNFIVTNSNEANDHITRIHEHLFSRNPVVAAVWRRQTFSAAVDNCTPELSRNILVERLPTVMKVLTHGTLADPLPGVIILEAAYTFSRMLHGSPTSSGSSIDAFYRAFVPELGSVLHPRQLELVRRCLRSEHGEQDFVGATNFPGLVKVTKANGPTGTETTQTVVRRAQVVCNCALQTSVAPPNGAAMPSM